MSKMIKKYFVLFLFIIPISLLAQKAKVKNDPTHDSRPIHFGFSIGLGALDYNVSPSDTGISVYLESVKPVLDIHAIANLRIAKYLDFRLLPGISLGSRSLHFMDNTSSSIIDDDNTVYSFNATYIELPMHLKYKANRLNNFSAYYIGGANIKYDLAAKGLYNAEDQLIVIKKFDTYLEIGFGFDFYLEYFKLSTELKYSYGLTNIMKRTDKDGNPPPPDLRIYSDAIDKINAQAIVLSIHFE